MPSKCHLTRKSPLMMRALFLWHEVPGCCWERRPLPGAFLLLLRLFVTL